MYDICNVLTHVHTNYTHTHTQYHFNDPCSHLSATCWLNGLIKIQLLEHQLLQAARVLWSHAHRHHQLSASPTLSFRSPLTAFISPRDWAATKWDTLTGVCAQPRSDSLAAATRLSWQPSHSSISAAPSLLHKNTQRSTLFLKYAHVKLQHRTAAWQMLTRQHQ